MYLMSLVSSSFMTRKSSNNAELVDHHTDPAKEHSMECHTGVNNGRIVPFPLAPVSTTAIAMEEDCKQTSKDSAAGGFSLLSANLRKTLNMMAPQSASREVVHHQTKAEGLDSEVTWAVSVLDRLISLAKQCHAVTKPTFDSIARPDLKGLKNKPTELQVEPFYAYRDSPVSPSSVLSDECLSPSLRDLQIRELGYTRSPSLEEVRTEASRMEQDTFHYLSPRLGESEHQGSTAMTPLYHGQFEDRESSCRSLTIPELETVDMDDESCTEESPLHYYPQSLQGLKFHDREELKQDKLLHSSSNADTKLGSKGGDGQHFAERTEPEAAAELQKMELEQMDVGPSVEEKVLPYPLQMLQDWEREPANADSSAAEEKQSEMLSSQKKVVQYERLDSGQKLKEAGMQLPSPNMRASQWKLPDIQPKEEERAKVPSPKVTLFDRLTKLDVKHLESEPLMEERDLQYPSPKVTELECQDEPSFRFWECESPPRRKSQSFSRDVQEFQRNDTDFVSTRSSDKKNENTKVVQGKDAHSKYSLEEIRKEFEQFPPQSLNEFESFEMGYILGEKASLEKVDAGAEEEFHYYPSPSSFTYELSPNSVFSDDQPVLMEPFHKDEPGDSVHVQKTIKELKFPRATPFTYRDSPASVLSQEPDEVPHVMETSGSPELKRLHNPCSSTFIYRDESSDLESLCDEQPDAEGSSESDLESLEIETFALYKRASQDIKVLPSSNQTQTQRPYMSKFTYSADTLVESSSEEDPFERFEDTETQGDTEVDFSELQYFQEAENWEPWLEKDGGALDQTDLQFLFPPNFKYKDSISSQEAVEDLREKSGRKSVGSERFEDSNSHWVPYVTSQGEPSSAGFDTPKGGSKRHLPAVLSHISKGIEKLAGSKRTVNFDLAKEKEKAKDEDENIFPSVSSWEVEEEGPQIMSSSRYRRKTARAEIPPHSFTSKARSASFVPSSNKRSSFSHLIPCSGRLFSWPSRILSFKVGKTRFMDSDDECGTGDRSFGASARRDAEQMKRILKGSQKKYSSLTVADILKEDFG